MFHPNILRINIFVKLEKMTNKKSSRVYRSSIRTQAAAATRGVILAAARQLFLQRGYVGATMQDIASSAGIALDTVYASVGRKPTIFRLIVETAISGDDNPIPAEQRDYVVAIRAEPTADRKLMIYAEALIDIHKRLAPVFRVLEAASLVEPDLKALWEEIAGRRAANMRLFAENLASTGALRKDLSVNEAADIIWSMNSPEFYLLLVEQRRWSPQEYATWLADAWKRLLLCK